MLASWIHDMSGWWATVSPEFAFLLALPLVVAAGAMAAAWWRRHRAPPGSDG